MITLNGLTEALSEIKSAKELNAVCNDLVRQIKDAHDSLMKKLLTATAPTVSVAEPKEAPKAKAEKPAKPKTEKAPTKAKTGKPKKEQVKQVSIASLSKSDIKEMDIKFTVYSEKSVLLTGNTRSISEELKSKGHWNTSRQGWFLKTEVAKEIAKTMKLKISKATV